MVAGIALGALVGAGALEAALDVAELAFLGIVLVVP